MAAKGTDFPVVTGIVEIDQEPTVAAMPVAEGMHRHTTQGADRQNGQPADFGPKENWKNGIFSCFTVIFTPLFWMGWFCAPLVWGQLMTRIGMTFMGNTPSSGNRGKNTFCVITALFILFLIVAVVGEYDFSYEIKLGLDIVCMVLIVYAAIMFALLRGAVRRKFRIQPITCGCCEGAMEDLCCGLWCNCCATIQMARHTHDEERYPYSPCSTSGLPSYAPPIAVV